MPESGPRGQGGGYVLVREVGLALLAAGVVVLLFIAYDLFGTTIAEQHSQAKLAREFNGAVHRPTTATTRVDLTKHPHKDGVGDGDASKGAAPSRGAAPQEHLQSAPLLVPPPGGALDHLVIPAIGVDRYVVEGVQEQDLQMGPGHYPGTPLPGHAGNVAIAGHRTTYGAPFFRLNDLHKGDLIYLTDLSGTTWVYSVERQWVVSPSDVGVIDPTRGDDLTLTTCNPRFWATTRLVVRAVLVEHLGRDVNFDGRLPVSLHTTQTTRDQASGDQTASTTTTTAAPTTVGRSGRAATGAPKAPGEGSPVVGNGSVPTGGSSSGTWATALGLGALVVAVWAAARLLAARRRRYAKLAVLLAGAVVCLVPLWFAFGAVVALLPANF